MTDEVTQWFLSLPVFTRYWFGLSVFFPLIGRVGLISPYTCIMNSDFISKLHIWRPITALFYYPISPQTGFHYLMNLYFLYNYSIQLEKDNFAGRPADYFFMLIFNWICITLTAYAFSMYLLMDPMILSVIYIWCQLHKEAIVRFWFGIRFKAQFLPWVLFGFNLIINGGGFSELVGIIVGHLYTFLVFTYPAQNGGPPLLQTPQILNDYFPPQYGSSGAQSGSAGQSGSTFRRSMFNWRGGHRLGSS